MDNEVILRFSDVSFDYRHDKPILDEVNFSVRRGSKITLMGQNGAGKSSLFALIMGELQPKSGRISIDEGSTIATARQVIIRDDLKFSITEYFSKAYDSAPRNLDNKITEVMSAVNLDVAVDKKVGELSGGQQARLLLAFALIQDSDILLLDEPTNNLDKAGIDHLITFLMLYEKTVIVISHDADFLNCFTEGVIYLDNFTHKIEIYVGDYDSVVKEITQRVEREQMKNAQLKRSIIDRKEKVNFFANKGGKMRRLAKKLKDETADLEENMVSVRKEDKAIREFTIPVQDIVGKIVTINRLTAFKNHELQTKDVDIILRQGMHYLVVGPNGIGKSTFLRSLVSNDNQNAEILGGVKIGYYSQNFANLDFEQTVFDSLSSAMDENTDIQTMRSISAGFLLNSDLMGHKVGDLSEGQKGLLAFARIVIMQPGLLIMDEPTNHINFRHLPVIARAIDKYKGAMVLVSHMPEFVKQIKFVDEIDLGRV